MKTSFSLAAAALLLGGCVGFGPEPGAQAPIVGRDVRPPPQVANGLVAPDRVAALEALLDREQAQNHYPAITVGFVTRGGLAWASARGPIDDTSGRPADADSIFRIASITKVFTGAALLQLRDAGRLNLDDPVEKTVPELRGVVYPGGDRPPITIRQLVTHRSGLPRLGKVHPRAIVMDISEAQLLTELDGLPLEATPGTRFIYSNLAMALAGVIIHRVSEPYPDYMKRHIFAPLGMNLTFARLEDVPRDHLAAGHRKVDDLQGNGGMKWRLGQMGAAGGIYTTVNDLARFAQFSLAAWTEGEDGGPLSRATRREWQTPQIPGVEGKGQFGINWNLVNDAELGRVARHTGANNDYSSSLLTLPDRGVASIVLISGAKGSFAARFSDAVAKVGLGLAPSPPTTPSAPEGEVDALAPWLVPADVDPELEADATDGVLTGLPWG